MAAAEPGANKKEILRSKYAELPPLELDTLQERFNEVGSRPMLQYLGVEAVVKSLEQIQHVASNVLDLVLVTSVSLLSVIMSTAI